MRLALAYLTYIFLKKNQDLIYLNLICKISTQDSIFFLKKIYMHRQNRLKNL